MPLITEEEYLENMGRPDWPPPASLISSLYPEPQKDVDVYLVVVRSQVDPSQTIQSRDQHWMFQWNLEKRTSLGDPVYRRLQIVRERDINGTGKLDHLTNWGAMTVAGETNATEELVEILLKKMTMKERKEFEAISDATRVRKPDGNWNCQDWCKSVLEASVATGLLTEVEVNHVVMVAESIEPTHSRSVL
ncbi:hypothetical protein CVT26_008444 [Gymnopilus dilepis]|uniref:Uncharacterized protein n=1 Tax=Gymnopilus dilepis TaxID=231916 RepID=A0A409XXD7_9AGAR|nr:hypothetical protein CVT26_008444 [Gymnopilus dilepis]